MSKEIMVSTARLTSTGAVSSGFTIPMEIFDELGWERRDLLRIALLDDKTLSISKIDIGAKEKP